MKMYWDNNGKYQKQAEALQKLIPVSGQVKEAVKNPKLEIFRQAVNCYHDLYNNGLYNRAKEFAVIFGFGGSTHASQVGINETPKVKAFMKKVEDKMNEIVLAAAGEQAIS